MDTFREMDKKAQGLLTSAAWRGSVCYMTCQLGFTFRATCNQKNDTSRICPNEHELCQAQCWSTLEKDNYASPLYGHDKLHKWGSSVHAAMNASRQHYEILGNFLEKSTENTTLSDWMMNLVDPLNSNLQLPICRSRNLVVQALEHPDKDFPNFPCTCGNWMSSDTAVVLDAISMGRNSSAYRHGLLKGTLLSTCPVVSCR